MLLLAVANQASSLASQQAGPQLPKWVLIVVCVCALIGMAATACFFIASLIAARKKNCPPKRPSA